MKNLQNYGVQELNTNEAIKVEGGRPPSTLDTAVYIGASITHAIVDFFSGAIDRFNEYRK